MDALFDKSSSSGFRSSPNAFTSADLDLVISGLKFSFRSFGKGKSLGLVFNPSGNALVLSFRNFAFNFLMLRRVADTFLDARSPNSMTYINTIAISNSDSHLQKWNIQTPIFYDYILFLTSESALNSSSFLCFPCFEDSSLIPKSLKDEQDDPLEIDLTLSLPLSSKNTAIKKCQRWECKAYLLLIPLRKWIDLHYIPVAVLASDAFLSLRARCAPFMTDSFHTETFLLFRFPVNLKDILLRHHLISMQNQLTNLGLLFTYVCIETYHFGLSPIMEGS